MTWGRWYVVIVAGLAIVQLLGYEFYAVVTKEKGDTISEFVWAMVAGRPWLSAILAIGLTGMFCFLMGHFFWQRS